jgi:putative ABC transport system permease protein
MLQGYLKLALRTLLKNKVYSLITISGLAIGLTGFILIGIYIRKETSFDKAFALGTQIYRLNTQVDVNGVSNKYSGAHYPAAHDMVEEFPEVAASLTLYDPIPFQGVVPKIRYGENEFSERSFLFTDSSFFSFFDFPVAQGDPRTALHEVNSMVLTHETAIRLFGNENPIGKLVTFNDSISFKVTAVLKPISFNTHLRFDYLVHSKYLIQRFIGPNIQLDDSYIGMWYYAFVILKPGASPTALEGKLADFVKRHYPPRYTDNHAALKLQNVRDIHLHSNFAGADLSPNGNIDYLYVLSIIGAMLLLIACINFVNLSTARYMTRAKEVGLRKVVGAQRIQLVTQFTGEAIVITFLAGLLSVGGVAALIPFFNQLANASIEASELFNATTLIQVGAFFVGVGILSGVYPAVALSAFQPIRVLKGMVETPGETFSLRKVLVVVQFAVSITLIIGTIVVYNQLDFLRGKSMGFDRDQVIMLPVQGNPVFRLYPSFKQEVERLGNVKSVTNVSHDLGQKNLPYYPVVAQGKDEEQMVPHMYAGFDFLETFGIEMIEGRFFDRDFPSDSALAFVVNEAAVKTFGWKDPLGKKLKGGFRGSDSTRVIGVIRDFNFDPLKSSIAPLAIQFSGAFGNIAIKLGSGNNRPTIAEIEQIWMRIYPEIPFTYYFLDDGLKATYAEEERVGKIYTVFCLLALLIASLGLFALASFTIRRRLKEISVRKVLGASESSLVVLIYRDFLLLILMAFTLAAPASIFIFRDWLAGFAYHIELKPLYFILAIIVVILISWLTLAFQLVRASRVNPAVVLRSE